MKVTEKSLPGQFESRLSCRVVLGIVPFGGAGVSISRTRAFELSFELKTFLTLNSADQLGVAENKKQVRSIADQSDYYECPYTKHTYTKEIKLRHFRECLALISIPRSCLKCNRWCYISLRICFLSGWE